jgi:TonB family protein
MKLQSTYDNGIAKIENSWDETGKAEVVNGNGFYIQRNDTTGIVERNGNLRKFKEDRTWTYYDREGKKEAEVVYKNGKFISGTRYDETGKTFSFKELSTPPSFSGGEAALGKFLGKNIKQPHEAIEKGISGTVALTFVVDKEGKVTRAAIHSGVAEILDKEALRVINLMPDWVPGTQRGKKIDVQQFMIIRFSIQE